MARIRSLKPEMLSDEKLAPLDVTTRFVFVGLICMADDCGRLLDNMKQIDASIFPETDDTAREALARLSRIGRILRGKTASGQKVIQILNWAKHQRVDHPNMRAALPQIVGCNEDEAIREPLANDSRGSREEFPSDSRLDQGPTTYDQGPTTKGPGSAEGADAPAAAPPPDSPKKTKRKKVPEPDAETAPFPPSLESPACRHAADEWIQHRRLKRAPMSETQLQKTLAEYAPFGAARFIAAVNHSISNGYQGLFEPKGADNGARPSTENPARCFDGGDEMLKKIQYYGEPSAGQRSTAEDSAEHPTRPFSGR